MSIDKNWEEARMEVDGIFSKIRHHILHSNFDLPGNFDCVITQDEFEASRNWESRLTELLAELDNAKDDLYFTEHLQVEKDESTHTDDFKSLFKPVGFDQGVSR